MNKEVLYFTLSLGCLLVVMSQFYGDKYITKFLSLLMPNAVKKGWF